MAKYEIMTDDLSLGKRGETIDGSLIGEALAKEMVADKNLKQVKTDDDAGKKPAEGK